MTATVSVDCSGLSVFGFEGMIVIGEEFVKWQRNEICMKAAGGLDKQNRIMTSYTRMYILMLVITQPLTTSSRKIWGIELWKALEEREKQIRMQSKSPLLYVTSFPLRVIHLVHYVAAAFGGPFA